MDQIQEKSEARVIQNNLQKQLEDQIDKEFEIQIRRFCEQTPIKSILEIALQNHETPNCKIRSVIEGIYSYYLLTNDPLFYELTCYLIEYTIIFTNEITNEAVIQIEEKLWKFSKKDFPYLGVEIQGRVKSLESELHDLITKLLKKKIVQNLLSNSSALDTFLSDAGIVNQNSLIKVTLNKIKEKYSNSLNKDTFGFMVILDYCDRKKDSKEPEYLKKSAIRFANTCIDVLKKNGTEILDVKDFISTPKSKGYTALHIVTRTCEIQILTNKMYISNNDPRKPSSHSNYKNTYLNRQLLEVITNVAYETLKKELPKEVAMIISCPEDLNDIDNLDCHPYDKKIIRKEFQKLTYRTSEPANPFSSKHKYRTPDDEIPKNIEDLKTFEGIAILEEFQKNHQDQFHSDHLL